LQVKLCPRLSVLSVRYHGTAKRALYKYTYLPLHLYKFYVYCSVYCTVMQCLLAVQGKADTSRSQRPSITEDPTAWVLQTYPWPLPAPSPLMSLKPECDDSRDHSGYSQSASNTSLSAATSADAEDQLVSMHF